MNKIIAIAVALAFSTGAFAQAPKAEVKAATPAAPATPAQPTMAEKVKEAGAKNTAATNQAKAKKKADVEARDAASKEARDKRAAERKAKKEARAKAKMDAKK